MDVRDRVTMLQEDSDLIRQESPTTSNYTAYILERGERAEARKLDELLEEVRAEKVNALKTLETEWPDYRDVWQPMIQAGDSPAKALNFLKSFA